MGRTDETGCKTYVTCVGASYKSLLWHSTDFKWHSIKFNSTSVLNKATGYMDLLIIQAIEIVNLKTSTEMELSISLGPGTQ
jgi:hypothetical protein